MFRWIEPVPWLGREAKSGFSRHKCRADAAFSEPMPLFTAYTALAFSVVGTFRFTSGSVSKISVGTRL
jgi:hypothetical protein